VVEQKLLVIIMFFSFHSTRDAFVDCLLLNSLLLCSV